MIDHHDKIEIDTELFYAEKAKGPRPGNKSRGWVDVVSKSIKKFNDPAPKMHAQQIEVVNSVLYEEREREKTVRIICLYLDSEMRTETKMVFKFRKRLLKN